MNTLEDMRARSLDLWKKIPHLICMQCEKVNKNALMRQYYYCKESMDYGENAEIHEYECREGHKFRFIGFL